MEIAVPILAINATASPMPPVPPGFHELFEKYAPAIFHTALRVTGDSADAEDVLQNVFLRMLSNRVSPDPAGSVENYMRKAATNASIDLLRRRAAIREVAIPDGLDYAGKESTVLLKERVRRALAKLDPEDAELFVLRHLEGISYDDLAVQFGLERGTVGSRLFRIREWLRKEIVK